MFNETPFRHYLNADKNTGYIVVCMNDSINIYYYSETSEQRTRLRSRKLTAAI